MSLDFQNADELGADGMIMSALRLLARQMYLLGHPRRGSITLGGAVSEMQIRPA